MTTFTEPTPTTFKARFPAFSALSDDLINSALAEADRKVDQSWPAGDYTLGKMLYMAHTLTLDGLGTSNEAQLAGFRRLKVGPLEIEREPASGKSTSTLMATSYGRRYFDLLRSFRPAVMVV